ncbi:MAG TPA: hypothetical protein VMB50_20410 [Myxococcales bacterium]|nr:hypothetical protein [Myxococcales bacterium]
MLAIPSIRALVGLLVLLDAAPAAAPDPSIARFDELWHTRDSQASAQELQTLASQFAQSDDYDKLWRVAHLDFWLADGAPNDDEKEKLAKAGWDVGKKAVAKKPDGRAGLYWTSVDIGMYSEAVGVVNALMKGLESKFRDPILRVEQLDPNHQDKDVNYVGPETSIGRYYYSLPWPKRSLSKSKAHLEISVKLHPEDLRARFYLAQTLESDGDKAGAKEQVDAIAAASPDYDPPEARRIKKRAAAWAADKLH